MSYSSKQYKWKWFLCLCYLTIHLSIYPFFIIIIIIIEEWYHANKQTNGKEKSEKTNYSLHAAIRRSSSFIFS